MKPNIRIPLIVGAVCLFLFTVDRLSAPPKAQPAPPPFRDGDCLSYRTNFPHAPEKSGAVTTVCFERFGAGFREVEGALTSTYDADGFTVLSPEDVIARKKAFHLEKHPLWLQELDEKMMRRQRTHSRFFGPPGLQRGALFYGNKPVVARQEYEGEGVYVVEDRPWENRAHAERGVIAKGWYRFVDWAARRKAVFWAGSSRRMTSSADPLDRYYYSLETGVLLAQERVWVQRDKCGRIAASDASLAARHSMARLEAWRHAS